jgi:6-pyruvoyltetrahydropterin/6-carboxytetrahydropterin synthase
MYYIEKEFKISGGHRLSKHKGRCFSIHGHNYDIVVGVRSPTLDVNDMVIDFSNLKKYVEEIVDPLDHCLLVNQVDLDDLKPFEERGMRIGILPEGVDPTAERISEYIFNRLKEMFSNLHRNIYVDHVTVYETDEACATYSED